MPALLIGGELHGQRVPVRLGLSGLPPILVFPKMLVEPPEWHSQTQEVEPLRSFVEVRYRLYDDVPAKYLHEDEWGGNDDDNGPTEFTPTPSPGVLTC